jgi:hypothetical protein
VPVEVKKMNFSLVGVDGGSVIAVRSIDRGLIHRSFGRVPGVVTYIAAAMFPYSTGDVLGEIRLLFSPQVAVVRCPNAPPPMVHVEDSMILIRC